MPQYIDSYVLAPTRSARKARAFLDHFVPHRELGWDLPDLLNTLELPKKPSVSDVLNLLEREPQRSVSLYFRQLQTGNPEHAGLIFNDDGSCFFMLSIASNDSQSLGDDYLSRMKVFAESAIGYWGWEEPPVEGRTEFLLRVGNPKSVTER